MAQETRCARHLMRFKSSLWKRATSQLSLALPLGAVVNVITKSGTDTVTILDFAGVSSTDLDGISLSDLLAGQAENHRRILYFGLGGWRMATDGHQKVVTGFTLSSGRNGPRLSKSIPRSYNASAHIRSSSGSK